MSTIIFVIVMILVFFTVVYIEADKLCKREKRIQEHIKKGDIIPDFLESGYIAGCDLPSSKTEENFIITSKYMEEAGEFPGVDGTYFKIPFKSKFEHGDIISADLRTCPALYITDEPIIFESEYCEDGSKCEYYTHTVVISKNRTGWFFPKKYLYPGTVFFKIPTAQ